MTPIKDKTKYLFDYYGKVKFLPDYTLPLPPDPPTVGRPKRNRKAIKAARKQAAKHGENHNG